MKRLLICILAIAMMLSSVAFANESGRINCEEFRQFSSSYFLISQENALEVQGSTNGNTSSTFEAVADSAGKNGKVVKLTIPSINGVDPAPTVFPYINSNFQDQVTESRKGTFNSVSYGFSIFPVDNSESINEMQFTVSVKYITPGNTSNQTHVMCKIKDEALWDGSGKFGYNRFVDGWFDLRFDIDVENKVSRVYVNDEFFCENQFASDIEYLRYINISSSVAADSNENDADKIAYFDNFFVNETPETLNNKTLKNIDYSDCFLDDDFSDAPIKATNAFNSNDGGGKAEKIDGVANFIFEGEVTTSVPSMASSAVSKKGTGGYVDGQYLFEIDMMFSNFDGESKLGYLKYNVEGNTSTDYNTHPAVLIEDGGLMSVGENENYKPVTQLVKNKWYNFKFHYKARNVSGGKNKGLLVDVYFQDNLVGENLYITNLNKNTDKFVNTIRTINFQSGTATKARTIYADNAKFYAVNKVEINPVQIVDVEVSNASGDLISSTYAAGTNKVTAYVTSVSDLKSSVTLVAARYSATGELIEVKAVPAGDITKDTLTKVTANLNAADAQAGEYIKVMIVDSTNTLNPYIKPVTLSSSVQ